MNINDFFNFNSKCPHCALPLEREGQIDILIDSDKPNSGPEFGLAGTIRYEVSGTKFNKISPCYLDRYEKELKILFDQFPKSFSINRRFMPRINKKNISRLISPLFINSVDARFVKFCAASDHNYSYQSGYLCENEISNSIEIDHEVMCIYGYRIFNKFNCSPKITIIGNDYDTILFGEKMNYVPISKWRTQTKDTLEEQIENYKLLK